MKNDNLLTEGLIKIIEAENLTELSYEEKGYKVLLKRNYDPLHKNYGEAKNIATPHLHQGGGATKVIDDTVEICSTGIGHFQFAKKGKKSVIEKGNDVNVGDEIGYAVAMGIKSPIISEFSGKVTKVLVKEGEVVDFGKPICKLKK
ncbi:MAG: acetyl-CoA carboxylase biotin carboxyl carrier protein [Fusobacteriaceae bacterium]